MQEKRKRVIRQLANTFRDKCVLNNYGIANLFKDCKKQNFKLLRYPLGENADLGLVVKKDNDIIIFTNTSFRLSREIFTLAHEIGHVIMHLNDSISSFVDNNSSIYASSFNESNKLEEEANYFAACLLMPKDVIEKFIDLELNKSESNELSAIDIAIIMSEFSVSFDMVLNRLESLHIITPEKKLLLDNERNEKRVSNLLKSVGGNYQLNLASHILDIPEEYLEYLIKNYTHKAIPLGTLQRALSYYNLTLDDISDKIDFAPDKDNIDIDELIGGLEN